MSERRDVPLYKDWVSGQGIWRTMLQPYLPVGRVDLCPSAEIPFSGTYLGEFVANYGWPYGIPPSGFKNYMQISHPKKLAVMGDTHRSWYINIQPRAAMTSTADFNFTFRHQGKTNVLYLDGHVSGLSPEEIPAREESSTIEYREFWDGRLL